MFGHLVRNYMKHGFLLNWNKIILFSEMGYRSFSLGVVHAW